MKGMKMNNDKSNEGQENGAADRGQSAARLKRFYGAPGARYWGGSLRRRGTKAWT